MSLNVREFGRAIFESIAERPLAVGFLSLMLVLLAGLSLDRMPLQLLPEIRYPHIRIIGDLPGYTSNVIEESLNEPLEAALASVQGIVRTESRAGDARAYIDLFFEPDYDIDRALADVTQAAQSARAQIPPDFPEPRIFAVSTLEEPAMQLAFWGDGLSATELRRTLRGGVIPRLRGVPGVAAVYLGREEMPELVVDVDPRAQIAMGIPLSSIETSILQSTRPPSSGALRTSDFDGLGVVDYESWDPKQLSMRHVMTTGMESIPLNEIGRVQQESSEQRLKTRYNGNPAVLVTIHRASGAHTLQLADRVHEVLESVEKPLGVDVLYDDSVVVRGAVTSVITAALGGALLAIFLLLLVMRQRRNLPLIGVSVVVSLAISILVLGLLGQTLNLLTLAGLLLSVGLGLDYAIVYFDRLESKESGTNTTGAMLDVSGPLLGALFTTLMAVLPFLFVSGLVAMLFVPLIVTVIISSIVSFLTALVILPAFSRLTELEEKGRKDWSQVWQQLHHPAIGISLGVLLLALIVLVGRELSFESLPTVDDGFVQVRITHPAGIPFDRVDLLARDVEESLEAVSGTEGLFTVVGGYFREGLPSFRAGTANFLVRVDTQGGSRPSSEWAREARNAINDLHVPGLRVRVTPPRIRGVRTSLSDSDLSVVLSHIDDDLVALGELEGQVIELVSGVSGLVDVERVRAGVSPRWRARPNTQALALYDVDLATLEQTVDYALDGRLLRQRMVHGEPFGLRVRFDRHFAGGPHQLHDISVLSRLGTPVRLDHLVDFDLIEDPTHIERREGRRVVRVSAQLSADSGAPTQVGKHVEDVLRHANFPDKVSWWIEGELEAIEETRQTFAMALLLALLAVLSVLVVQYGRLSLAIPAVLSIPMCGAGALGLLYLFGRPLDAMALAGMLIAIGIIANNVILVISQTLGFQEREIAMREALVLAVEERFRPIALTTLSTVLGMSPLMFGGAEVYGLLQPLAISLTGALLLSIPVSCIILPGLLLVFNPRPLRAVIKK